eukprot:TRINITY_DN9894_c0_g1_i1.p1 TRINITY_DN9894_c0_g1~~TRINITY_DN9894_c0_g1_i1.p1  ORF type:complete len:635 (-),score=80.83 TRINITY_DN9894_c0_g1_i1:238-2001(-)
MQVAVSRSHEIYDLGLPIGRDLHAHTLSFTAPGHNCRDLYTVQCYIRPYVLRQKCSMASTLISADNANMIMSLVLQVLIFGMLAKHIIVFLWSYMKRSVRAYRENDIQIRVERFSVLSSGLAWFRAQVLDSHPSDISIAVAENKLAFFRTMLQLQPLALAVPLAFYAMSLQSCWAWMPDDLQSATSQRILYDSPLIPLTFQLSLSVVYQIVPAWITHLSIGRIDVLLTPIWIAHFIAASAQYFERNYDSWARLGRLIQVTVLGSPCKSLLLQSIVSAGYLIAHWRTGRLGPSMIGGEIVYLSLLFLLRLAIHHVRTTAASHLVELRLQNKTQSRLLAATMDGYLVLQRGQGSFQVSEMNEQARNLFSDADICGQAENPQEMERFLQAAATVYHGPALLQCISFKSGAGRILLQCFAFSSAQGLVLAVRKENHDESESREFPLQGAQFEREARDDSQAGEEGCSSQMKQASVLGRAQEKASPTKQYIRDLKHMMGGRRVGSNNGCEVDEESLRGVTIEEERLSDTTDLQPATLISMADIPPCDQAERMTVTRYLDSHKRLAFRDQLHHRLQNEDFGESIEKSRNNDSL